MSFIALLLTAIALTIIQIASIYNRGLTTTELNSTSRNVSDEITRSMREGGSFSLNAADQRYVSGAWGGRMCLGKYSYIWNYAAALERGDTKVSTYTTGDTPITFIRVPDGTGAYCVPSWSGAYPKIVPEGAVELLQTGDHTLSIHRLVVTSAVSAGDELSKQRLYTVDFTLGTDDIDALNDTQTECKAPNEPGADTQYCSIQRFTIVVRVVSGGN